jgi:hypothetical protein
MRPLLPALLACLTLAVPAVAEARIDPPPGVAPSQDLRSPDARDAATNVSYATPPAQDRGDDAPWELLLALPLGGGAAWAVRRHRRVRVAV